jgi:hypothetical protein
VSFEHDTQASTGQTTGVWAVRFCQNTSMSNWCIDGFSELWPDLCTEILEENAIVSASVDLSRNPKLEKRFHAALQTTDGAMLVLFKDHGMYTTSFEHPGDVDKTKEEVRTWIVEGYAGETKQVVPPEPSLVDSLKEFLESIDRQMIYGISGILAVGVLGFIVYMVVGKGGAAGRASRPPPRARRSPRKIQ